MGNLKEIVYKYTKICKTYMTKLIVNKLLEKTRNTSQLELIEEFTFVDNSFDDITRQKCGRQVVDVHV